MKFRKKYWVIKEIPHKIALDIVVEKHYLHRKSPCSFSFGLFKKENLDEIKGVIIYGTPPSAPLRMGICGKEEKNNVIELTRLWVADDVPRNGESFLVGNTLNKVNKEIIVSFADTSQNHTGYIYQATNFYYTGLSAKRTNWVIEGVDKHSHTIADKYTSKELKEKYGDKFKLVPRPRKHRYIYFNANKKRKKELLNKLKYPLKPYPKEILDRGQKLA